MRLGRTVRCEDKKALRLRRNMIGTADVLEVERERCSGCLNCEAVCPMEAIARVQAEVDGGQVTKPAKVDVRHDKCIFCGLCAVLCPTGAIALTRNGSPFIPIQTDEIVPRLMAEIEVEMGRCTAECGDRCQVACPAGAVEVTRQEAVGTTVAIEMRYCHYCGRCQRACPEQAVRVVSPWEGTIELNHSLCPSGCQACAQVCPSRALIFQNRSIVLDLRDCIFCGSCQKVCPEGALRVSYRRVLTQGEGSSAWFTALARLIGLEAKGRWLCEIAAKRHQRLLNTRIG